MRHLPLANAAAAAALAALAFAAPRPAAAQSAAPAPVLGAWGSDSSCTADVVIFRPDGSVVDTGAVPDTPHTTYSVNGNTITFTQRDKSGTKTGHFALAVANQAIAWSDGSSIVLKERCADQAEFAQAAGPAKATPLSPAALYDRIRALAAEPLRFGGVTIKVVGVDGHAAPGPSAGGPSYSEVIAHPDPATVGTGAELLYRIFPTAAAAAAHVSLAADMRTSFVYEHRGVGFFSTASAADEGTGDPTSKPVTINCLRFHPKGQDAVDISCFAQMPGSRLVGGGRQRFPLPKAAKSNDMGSKDELREALDLTSLAIDTLRAFLATQPSP